MGLRNQPSVATSCISYECPNGLQTSDSIDFVQKKVVLYLALSTACSKRKLKHQYTICPMCRQKICWNKGILTCDYCSAAS